MKAIDVITILERYFPLSLQEEWDNSGLQIGNEQRDVSKIMIALNANLPVIEQAIKQNVDLLITHHPLFFLPIKVIDTTTANGKAIELALKHDLIIYSSHTPIDIGTHEQGMNVWAGQLLGLKDIEIYQEGSHLRRGISPKETLDDIIPLVKEAFDLDYVFVSGKKEKIHNIVIGLGSGGDYIDEITSDIDVYITGECDFHEVQDIALNNHFVLLQVPHFTERIMKENVKEILGKEIDIEILLAKENDYMKFI